VVDAVNELVVTLLMPAALGALLGTLVGLLPGIGPAATMALLLPVTFSWPAESALIVLCAVYFGAQYGSSTTAILLNLPGEASGVVTAEQGHRMALDGRGGVALVVAAAASLMAGLATAALIAWSTPLLARASLALGPLHIGLLILLAAVAVVAVGQGGALRNTTMLMLGALIGLIGADFGGGMPRMTLGLAELRDGVGMVPLIVGLFGVSEVLASWAGRQGSSTLAPVGRFWPDWSEWRGSVPAALRGSALGAAVGMLPGGSTLLAALGSQSIERRLLRGCPAWERGHVAGVAGPEAANNASAQTGLIPLIGLGIPPNPAMAIMLGALLLHGVPPGMAMFDQHAALFNHLVWGIVLANLMLFVLNVPLVGLWMNILRIPMQVLMPLILMLSLIGVYAHQRSLFDVWLMIAFGVLGLVLRRSGFSLAPIVFGAVLAPLFEDHFRRYLMLW
jgi:putative tricarboxylic transport membrane protein